MNKNVYRKVFKYRENKRIYLLEVLKTKYLHDYVYELTFNNRVVKHFDFSNYLSKVTEKQVLFPLKENIEFFRQGKVANGTLSWPEEIEIAPEYLYSFGKTISTKKEIRNLFRKASGHFYWNWTSFKKASYEKQKKRRDNK